MLPTVVYHHWKASSASELYVLSLVAALGATLAKVAVNFTLSSTNTLHLGVVAIHPY